MRILIVGAGALGSYLGGMLQHGGHQVLFMTRGAHLGALQTSGLRIQGPHVDVALEHVCAAEHIGPSATYDVALFCTKLYDLEAAATAVKSCISGSTCCICLQNGVEGQDRLRQILPSRIVLGGLAYFSGFIREPGLVCCTSVMNKVVYGQADAVTDRLRDFRDACVASGVEAEISTDIRSAQWQKFVSLATNSALTALSRAPAGVVYQDSDLIDMARCSIHEVIAVGRAAGIAFADNAAAAALALLQSLPAEVYASMYYDLVRGRRLELEGLSGYVVRLGRQLGIATPVHALCYACLKPYVNGAVEGVPR